MMSQSRLWSKPAVLTSVVRLSIEARSGRQVSRPQSRGDRAISPLSTASASIYSSDLLQLSIANSLPAADVILVWSRGIRLLQMRSACRAAWSTLGGRESPPAADDQAARPSATKSGMEYQSACLATSYFHCGGGGETSI